MKAFVFSPAHPLRICASTIRGRSCSNSCSNTPTPPRSSIRREASRSGAHLRKLLPRAQQCAVGDFEHGEFDETLSHAPTHYRKTARGADRCRKSLSSNSNNRRQPRSSTASFSFSYSVVQATNASARLWPWLGITLGQKLSHWVKSSPPNDYPGCRAQDGAYLFSPTLLRLASTGADQASSGISVNAVSYIFAADGCRSGRQGSWVNWRPCWTLPCSGSPTGVDRHPFASNRLIEILSNCYCLAEPC